MFMDFIRFMIWFFAVGAFLGIIGGQMIAKSKRVEILEKKYSIGSKERKAIEVKCKKNDITPQLIIGGVVASGLIIFIFISESQFRPWFGRLHNIAFWGSLIVTVIALACFVLYMIVHNYHKNLIREIEKNHGKIPLKVLLDVIDQAHKESQ